MILGLALLAFIKTFSLLSLAVNPVIFPDAGMDRRWVAFAYAAVHALENNVIPPFIMARGMKFHPLAVVFSMLLCVAVFGVLGFLVAAPLVAIVSIVHSDIKNNSHKES